MRTSAKGIAFTERHEGVVLRAYRCPAGVWTIGAGLTAASGVVKPRAGMVISETEAARLLELALERNYEPDVRLIMPGAAQHEFDAGVSFHFNTGAIGRASWVKRWKARDWQATRVALGLWNKGGGKVLPGLSRRREEEFKLLMHGDYGFPAPVRPAPLVSEGLDEARIAAPITAAQIPAIREGLRRLGYPVGAGIGVSAEAVRRFQRDHALTVDGVIGRATASTLQRVLDARAATALPAAAAGVGAVEAAPETGLLDALTGLPNLGEAALALAAARLLVLAFTHRDTLAPVFDKHLPRVAALLRSF